MKAVDTHAHLDFPQFDADREALLKELADAQIGVINIATSIESNQVVAALAADNELVWAAVGVHPTDVTQELLTEIPKVIDSLKELIKANPKIVAIGEVGLDYHREEFKALAETQKTVLRQFLTFALEENLPVIFHCRDAYGDLVTLLADYPGLRGVIHCFTGTSDEAKRFLDLGLLISFTATITYPANESQRQAVSAVPLDKMLLETDCPFLVPQDRRGQRNDPKTIFVVAGTIAAAKKINSAEVLEQTTINAVKLFGLETPR